MDQPVVSDAKPSSVEAPGIVGNLSSPFPLPTSFDRFPHPIYKLEYISSLESKSGAKGVAQLVELLT